MVTVKEELPSLDRNDFDAVNKLIDRIIKDIWKTSKQEINDKWRDELKMAMAKDYMLDLINTDSLDFDK